jgi:hypothetical protein
MNNLKNDFPESNSDQRFPYKIFISHKVSEHGYAVKKLKNILNHDNTLKDKIEIYVSTDVAPGVDWAKNLYQELDQADMLLYIYCFNSPPDMNDWCNYETGYYAKKSNRDNIITLVPAGVLPPSPLQSYQFIELTDSGIKKLLRRIYVQEKIYPDLFDVEFKDKLDQITESVLSIFSPTQKPKALSPRIWITIKNESLKEFKKRTISLPPTSIITGETEAARKFGYESKENEEMSLDDLKDVVEFKGTLPLFYEVLSDTLQDILNRKAGPWRVPPVKVLKNSPPNILVPAYMEKMPNGDRKFEFIVTVPPINFGYPKEDVFITELYNLFIVSWHFRWRIIEKYLYEFQRRFTGNIDPIREDTKKMISKLKVDLNAVVLDSYNRNFQFPEDITRSFEGNDKIIMDQIVNKREGLWVKLMPIFLNACDDVDLKIIIECLTKMQDINKTCIVICLKLLEKVAIEKLKGDIIVDY